MRFHVTPGDELPIYRQIMRQVVDAIVGRTLEPGQKLPAHRQLAQDLVIAPLTVKKAYDELERAGHIQMVRGHGTFVSDKPASIDTEAKLDRIRPLVTRLLHEATLLGIDLDDIQDMLTEQNQTLQTGRNGSGDKEEGQ